MSEPDLAHEAIDYLVQHDLVLHWDFPQAAPPSQEIQNLLKPYLADGEIERTTSSLLCDYLVSRLREDHLAADAPCKPWHDRTPPPRQPTCRVVCGDDEHQGAGSS